jgi:hypothetical protein
VGRDARARGRLGLILTPYAGTNRIRFYGTLSADDHRRRRHPGLVRER